MDDQDNFFVYLKAEKLPTETRKCWELSSPGRNPKRYLDMKNFMEERTRAIEEATQQSASAIDKKPTSSPKLRKLHSHIATSVTTTCEFLRQKPQKLSMPKFQSTFSTGPSSVD